MDEDAMAYCLNYERLIPVNLNEDKDDIWRLSLEFVAYVLNKFEFDGMDKEAIFDYIRELNIQIKERNEEMWMSAQGLEDREKFKRKMTEFTESIEQKLKTPNEYETIISKMTDIVVSKITRLPSDEKNSIIRSWEAKIAK